MTSSKHSAAMLRRVLISLLLGLPALLFVGVGWLVWFLDLKDHKPLIQRLLRENLGIEVVLEGRLDHRLSAGVLQLTVRNVRVANSGSANSGSDAPIAQLDQCRLGALFVPAVRVACPA